jgi:hypothetical protein
MTLSITFLAVVVAVAAAVRSTWSPCGLSMLSTITPMAERSRGRNWWATATWFLLGATVGGALLGAPAALLAAVVGATGASTATLLGVATALGVLAVALDLGLAGTTMPHHRRQVDEQWLDQFRSWVYGAGFGVQIGTGLATYIMTAAVYLTVALAALTGRPWTALAICTLFGSVRGLAIFLGVRLDEPVRVALFHFRFEEIGPTVRRVVIAVQALVATAAASAAGGVPAGIGVAAACAVLALVATRLDADARPTSTGREPAVAEA